VCGVLGESALPHFSLLKDKIIFIYIPTQTCDTSFRRWRVPVMRLDILPAAFVRTLLSHLFGLMTGRWGNKTRDVKPSSQILHAILLMEYQLPVASSLAVILTG